MTQDEPHETPCVSTEDSTVESSTEVGSVFVSNYPPFSVWNEPSVDPFETRLRQPSASEADLGLYLHIPFCRKRCKFCYFRVYIDKNATQIQRYLDALARELELYADVPSIADRPVRFVYFGGGTPSYIAVKHLQALVARAKAALPWDEVREVTFECEPGTLTESKVVAYREIGVTRLSLGIENFNDKILQENGRAHLTHEIFRCLPWIRAQGFAQLNIDLIAGMVGETWQSWRETVEKTIDIDPDSVTIYQMELPFNTVYSQGILDGDQSPVAGWELKREWNAYAIEQLEQAGYRVSSAYTMVKPSKDSQFVYRDALWHGADLLGTGIASFGHVNGFHAQNVSSWNDYLEAVESGRLPLGRAYETTERDRLTRELILQMKLGRLDLAYFRDKFGVDPLSSFGAAFEHLENEQMLSVTNDALSVELSADGLLQVDALLPRFYEQQYRDARYT